MNFLKEKLSKVGSSNVQIKENTNTLLNNAKELGQKTFSKTRTELQKGQEELAHSIKEQKYLMGIYHPRTSSDFLVRVAEGLFFMAYPEESIRVAYGNILKKEFTVNYRIWNVSEYSYDSRCFNDQVHEYVNVGYPNPPLIDLFMICKEIDSWLTSNPSNLAIVHCQQSKSRSCLVLSCYLFYKGVYSHPGEALTHVCDVLPTVNPSKSRCPRRSSSTPATLCTQAISPFCTPVSK